MFKCVLSKMKYFLSSFELQCQMILLIFSVRFQFNNFNYSITTSRFLRLNLSEMHMRTLWHQTIGGTDKSRHTYTEKGCDTQEDERHSDPIFDIFVWVYFR